MKTKILALDLATTCGWAVSANGVITSGSQCFTRYHGSKSRPQDHLGMPYSQFRNWLADKLHTDKPDQIAYEEVMRWGGASAAHCFGGFRGIMLDLACRYNGIPCFGYVPTAIKKYWAGKGNADKDDMVAATLLKYPNLDLSDDNEADALAILSLHQFHQKQITSTKPKK